MITSERRSSSLKETYPQQTNSISTFVIKIYNLLNDPQNAQAICWHDDGKSFLIRNTNLLTNQILPHYFRHNNYQSFIRQLNMYNFTKLKDHAVHRFENQYFIREREESLKYIKRKPEKKKRRQSDESISSQKENQLKLEILSVKSIQNDDREAKTCEMKAEEVKNEQPELPQPVRKKVCFNDNIKVENSEENISTIIEATSKWINNKEQSYWNNFKSLKSIELSMKLIDNEDEEEQEKSTGKLLLERKRSIENPIILLFNPNISEKTIKQFQN